MKFITDKQKIPINIKPAYPKPFGQRQGSAGKKGPLKLFTVAKKG